jgi:hypothetical protein
MRPDKHKKKDFFDTRRDYWDDHRAKYPKPNDVQDEDLRDELPSKAPSVSAQNRKHYSNAFMRFIRTHIGKPWDEVYAKISEKLGNDKDDIKYYIDFDAYKKEDGTIYANGIWGESEVRGFYVMNGILGEQRKSYKRKRDVSKVKVTYVDEFVVFKHNNIYFKAPLDKSIPAKELWWNTSGTDYNRTECHIIYTDRRNSKTYRGGAKYAIPATHIRQLSSKELKNWDLPNTEINENLGLRFR